MYPGQEGTETLNNLRWMPYKAGKRSAVKVARSVWRGERGVSPRPTLPRFLAAEDNFCFTRFLARCDTGTMSQYAGDIFPEFNMIRNMISYSDEEGGNIPEDR